VDVPEAGQHGVHEQRERQAQHGRHKTGQDDEVLPAATCVHGRGRWFGVRDANERLQDSGHRWPGRGVILHAVSGVRYMLAVAGTVKVTVRGQREPIVHHFSLGTSEAEVVRQHRAVRPAPRTAVHVRFIGGHPERRLALLARHTVGYIMLVSVIKGR